MTVFPRSQAVTRQQLVAFAKTQQRLIKSDLHHAFEKWLQEFELTDDIIARYLDKESEFGAFDLESKHWGDEQLEEFVDAFWYQAHQNIYPQLMQ